VSNILNKETIESVIDIANLAGDAIMSIYNTDFDYELKDDNSPLTEADLASNNIIMKRLEALTPSIPIISEESCNIPFKERSKWKDYWLVDPLDGTKEFLKRNGEFTVNIALLRNNKPILGVINIPATQEKFYGSEYSGSYLIKENGIKKKIFVSK
jgi:3''-Phosphoadenosine 5''-phosphosulfate (PAPS) 3''-phosphatase